MAGSLPLADGRLLSYDLSGPSSAPVVLLANSLCAPYRAWDNVTKALHDNGFQVLRFDQPGHGASTTTAALDTTMESIADDVYALIQSLKIAKLHSWIGVSMGAAVSFYFVTKYPGVVQKLIVCDTISSSTGTSGVFGPRVAAAREAGSMNEAVEQTLQRWVGDAWLAANPEETRQLRAIMRQTTVDGFAACCNALMSDTFDSRPLFEKVGVSVDDALLVVGEKDANLPQTMAEMRDRVQAGFDSAGKKRSIKLEIIENAGHVCFVDGFENFCSLVTNFLKA
jgi:3-oxoadipate enol-lactonase